MDHGTPRDSRAASEDTSRRRLRKADQRVARQPQGAAARFTARAYLPRRPVCWTRRLGGRPSVGDEELLHRHADISGDLAKQCRGDVTTRMKRDRRDPAIRVAELLVRAALPHLREAVRLEKRNHLPGFQDWDGAHR